ncbi:MAG: hypothetical protein M3Y36_06735 [Actinomycetota bacterium]|nr:hypothetical protein [Actinomycetota bacterium]
MTALILGFFAFVWFGWGQAAAHGTLSVLLGAGSVVGVLIAAAGVVVTVRSSPSSTPMADPRVRLNEPCVIVALVPLEGRHASNVYSVCRSPPVHRVARHAPRRLPER